MTHARGPSATNPADVVLELRGVSVRYAERRALDDVTVRLTAGVTALVGVNGAGKTTLMRTAAGANRPLTGHVQINGKSPYLRGERRAALMSVALMPQEVVFPGNMTASEVVEYLGWMRGLTPGTARARASAALEAVGLDERRRSRIRELSGGMVRRVALAQAVASSPDVLLLDEPSTGLDPQQRRVMVDLIGNLDGCVVLSSHIMEDVAEVASRVLVLDEGRMVFDGTVEQLSGFAPLGVSPGRAAEAGFLHVITEAQATRR